MDRPEVQRSRGAQRRGCCFGTLDRRWSPRSSDSVNLVTMPCDSEELRVHRLDAGETCDLCWNHDTSCGLSVVSGPCRTLELAVLTLDSGFGMQAELRTDSAAAEGLGRYDPSTAQLCGCNKQSHDGAVRIEKHAGWTPSADVGTKAGSAVQKMRELLTRLGCHRSAGRADVAL